VIYYFTHALIDHLIIFQAISLVIILSNVWILSSGRRHAPPALFPAVSILVPARNEEKNIARCVGSLLAQDYPDFDVFILDDQSEDATRSILDEIALSQTRLHVIAGRPLPADRLGKSWACAQLAEQAPGELLFFTDADTIHAPHALRSAVTALIGERADLLTGYPRQEVRTWGERLAVPFFSWAFYCFIPLAFAYRLRMPALSSALGQMLLFRRQAYQAVGGHNSVCGSIVEDLSLARRIKAAGLRWRMIEAADLITCRMYTTSEEAFAGFSKNLFAAFGFHLLLYLFAFTWLFVLFWEPLVVLVLYVLGLAPYAQPALLVVCLGLSLLLWLVPYRRMGFPLLLALLYPVTVLANEIVAFRSLLLSLSDRLIWKGRKLPRPRWKWL
jgi:chlorobactene glucosyltransferase